MVEDQLWSSARSIVPKEMHPQPKDLGINQERFWLGEGPRLLDREETSASSQGPH